MDRGDHGAHAGGVRDVLHAPDDLDRPRAVQVVEDQVDQVGALGLPRAAAAVPVVLEQSLDLGAGAGSHVGAAVQHARHRRHRDPGLAGDVGDGDAGSVSGRHPSSFVQVGVQGSRDCPGISITRRSQPVAVLSRSR